MKLPSGGEIIIDTTEALTAIDVNSAKSTKGDDIESTALHTNLEAIDILSTQLRLRDIGGIVVIDFIDMLDKKNRAQVEEHAKSRLYCDRAKIKIEGISPLTGCLSLLRQRLKSSNQSLMMIKSVCHVDSYCYLLLRLIETTASDQQTSIVQLQTSVNMGTYLLNECRDIIQRIQNNYSTDIQIIPNSNFENEKYEMKVVKSANRYTGKSFEQKNIVLNDYEPTNHKRNQKTAAVQKIFIKNLHQVIKSLFIDYTNHYSQVKKSNNKNNKKT